MTDELKKAIYEDVYDNVYETIINEDGSETVQNKKELALELIESKDGSETIQNKKIM